MAYETGSDRVASVQDPVTGTTAYTYNDTGERLTMTLPGGGTWTYGYAAPNALWPVTVPKDDPNSVSRHLVSLTDDQGRIVTLNVGGPESVYNGNIDNPEGQIRQVCSNQTFDANANLVSYNDTHYYYDRASYAGADPNSTLTHNWLQKLTTTYWTKVSGSWVGHLLSENDYTYDNAGQRLTNTVTDSSGNVRVEKYEKSDGTSGYDALNRLTNVDYGDGETQSYTFDAMGNRLSKQDSVSGTTNYAVDAANRLTGTTGAGASTYTNDLDGNTLTGGGRTNAWDSQNRLVSCALGSATTTYTYGADGLRRRSFTSQAGHTLTQGTSGLTVTDLGTSYAYDGTMLVREGHAQSVGGTSSLQPSTVMATYLIGARGAEYRRDDTATEVDSQGRTVTKARWYVFDGLGSVVGEVDPLGNLTSSPKYDVYGAVRSNSGTASSRQGFVGGLGHVSDTETGLVYMRARYMDPQTGRFVSEDSDLSGSNWFIYCDNNPVNEDDPTGKAPFSIGMGPEQVEKIFDLLADDPDATLGDIFEHCFSGNANIATGSYGGIQDAVAVLRFEVQGVISDIPGITAEGFGVIGHYVADENGQSGLAGIAENPELVEISVLEGEVVEADAMAIALPVEI